MKLIEKGLILIGLTTLITGSLASAARADLLGHVIVGGVTNQALTQVTQKDCSNATGAGADACAAADTVVDVHQDISNAVNQQVQRSCQNASGAGEDVCQGIGDVNSFKKQLSEQVSHIHLFGSHDQDSQSSPAGNSPAGNSSTTPDASSPENSPSNTQSSPAGNGAN